MNNWSNEQLLIEAFQKGNAQAFAFVFDMFYGSLCYFARKLTDDKEEAEDIVLETFRKCLAMHKNFETLPNIRAFLYITARNTCLNFLKYRQRKTARNKEYVYLHTTDDDIIERMRIESEVLRKIYAAVNSLPSRCREIFILTYFKGLPAGEIAKQLGISTSTVTTQRSIAIRFLRKELPLE